MIILNDVASGLSELVSRYLKQLFGPGVDRPVWGPVTSSDLGAMACLLLLIVLLHGTAVALLHRKIKEAKASTKELKHHFFGALGKPLYVLIWIYGFYIAITPLRLRLPEDEQVGIRGLFDTLFDLGVFMVLVWLFFRLTYVLEARLAAWTAKTTSKFDDLFVPLLGKCLRIIVPVIAIVFGVPILKLPPEYSVMIIRGSTILLIVAGAVILTQVVNLGERIVLAKYDILVADNLQARKIYTQIHVLSKTLYFVIGLFTIASVLMLFEEVRRLGTSILASAGVLGVILGFAAQKTIANLFAGFQLAMTQPIRLDDVVVVEGEWGRIEEITLTYVIIHIWDDRRLIVPLSYFIEKPFQNWTRASAQLLGSVVLSVDYSLPLDEARKALKEIIENHPLWDKRFWNLQVTDATEKTMQLRVLATSADSSKSWDLRCAIREQLIGYIQNRHPECLPQIRVSLKRPNPSVPSQDA
jgi:small-conductance mechanosensitive channel